MSLKRPAAVSCPSTWRTVPLWSLFERIKDVGHPQEDLLSVYREHGVVKREGRDDNFNKAALDRNIYQLVHPGWLVVNRMKAWQGSVGISPYRGVVSGHYICFRPTHQEDSRFLNWLLRSSFYTAEYSALSRGVRPNQVEIDNDLLKGLPVMLPGQEEQRRIADYLDEEIYRIDALSFASRRARSLLNERRFGTVFSEVIGVEEREGRWDPKLGWAESLPESWEAVPLKRVARLGTGHTPSRSNQEYWENCTIPWISLFDVGRMRDPRQETMIETSQKISELGMDNSSACLHPAGTVVLSRTASVGFSTVMATDMAVSQHFVTWTCGPRLSPYYLLYVLRAMRQYFESVQVGTTNVTVFMPDLYSIRVPLPQRGKQEEILVRLRSKLTEIDAAIDRLDRQISLLSERRQALITAAVTGQIDVTTARGADVA